MENNTRKPLPFNPPEGYTQQYVPADNPYIQAAKKYACENSLDPQHRTGSAIVKNGEIIGLGTNGSNYHQLHGCYRKDHGIPSGEGYELCEGCSPKNHSEPRAIENARSQGHDPKDSDIYLWGHFWLCEPCWNAVTAAGIKNVYLLEDSDILFDKTDPRNICGEKQCAA